MTAVAGQTFHEGEQRMQAAAGVRDRLEEIGPRVIRDHMPQQHRSFFEQLPFVVLGLVDAQGQPWASLLAAEPGFMQSPDDMRLDIAASLPLQDPLQPLLLRGAEIGLLGIEPHTRRRNRLNGVVERADDTGFSVRVTQSFGNCPKYIQPRKAEFAVRGRRTAPTVEHADALDAEAMRQIASADTFFIATAHPEAVGTDGVPSHGVDVSHRGGPVGFVRMDDAYSLTVPDYPGNFFFNTLGNLLLNPRAGLVFVDTVRGDLLHVAVEVRIVQERAALAAIEGAQRLLQMRVTRMQRQRGVLPLRWR
ncbi:MAG: pyridoxamine 5'-phosphate oxidase family protein [Variovorax sp.]